MNIVSEHKANKQDSHDPQNGAVPTPHTMLFQTRKAQAAELVEQRNERHGHVVQVPQHGGIKRRERLIFEDDLDHPQGANSGDGNKAAAQDVVQATQVRQHTPDRKCNCSDKQRERARMDERIHDLFGHLTIDGRGVGKLEI